MVRLKARLHDNNYINFALENYLKSKNKPIKYTI